MQATYRRGERKTRPGIYKRKGKPGETGDGVESAEGKTGLPVIKAWTDGNGLLYLSQGSGYDTEDHNVTADEDQGNLILIQGDLFNGADFIINENGEMEVKPYE